MTPQQLQAWQDAQGFTCRTAAQALGVSPATYFDWLQGTSRNSGKPVQIKRVVALACAAIAAGIKPL